MDHKTDQRGPRFQELDQLIVAGKGDEPQDSYPKVPPATTIPPIHPNARWPGAMLIVGGVAKLYGITTAAMLGHSKTALLCRARNHAWHNLRTNMGMSYPEIGKLFGRHHTTVMPGVRAHEAQIVLKVTTGEVAAVAPVTPKTPPGALFILGRIERDLRGLRKMLEEAGLK